MARQPHVPLRALVIISIVVVAVFLLASAGEANGGPSESVTYEVAAGDTLWSIAEDRTDGDVRSTIGEIRRMNELDSSTIYVGQVLELPPG